MKRTSMYTAVLALSLAMALAGGGLACRTFRERLDALEEQAVLQHQRNVCGLEDAFAAEYDTRSGAGYLSSGADSVCARVGQAYTRGQWLILGSSSAVTPSGRSSAASCGSSSRQCPASWPVRRWCSACCATRASGASTAGRMRSRWDRSREPHAGQFYMLRAWAADATPILSRPISVDDFDNQTGALTFLYQVKGEGTHKLAALKKDDTLTVTGPCGNGFDTAALAGQYKRIAVVGGGIGTAPLLLLCKELCRAGVRPDLFVGFRDTTYGMDRFVPWCRDIYAATDSGKEGHHGLVTDLLDVSKYDIVLTCGPMVMMRGVAKLLRRRWRALPGQP